MENVPGDIILETFSLMPPERQQQALRFRSDIDRNLCVLVFWLLLYGLKNEYGITEPHTFTYGENGKPYLIEHPDIFFNLSHCKLGAICAISNSEVGVDVQDVRPFSLGVAKRVCTERELERLAQSESSDRLFCELWTIKESFIKRHDGISTQSFSSLDAHALYNEADCKVVSHRGKKYHLCCFGENEIITIGR